MPKIKLPNNCKDTKIVAGCQFVDGEISVSSAEFKSVSNVLVRFFGCEVVSEQAEVEPVAPKPTTDATLAAKATKSAEVKVSK